MVAVYLVVGNCQVDVAVVIQIVLENALQDTLFGNVQILTAVAEGATAKGFKALGDPGFLDIVILPKMVGRC